MNTQERLERMLDSGTLKAALPHGSGIDDAWVFEERPNKILCHNSYHGMNEDGCYDGWLPFTVILFVCPADELNPLKGPSIGQVQVLHRAGDIDWELSIDNDDDDRDWACDLDEYLGDIIQYALSEAKLIDTRGEILPA